MNNNLLKVTSQSGLNQIRGINRAGSTGAGIPAHVTNLSASVSNASTGLTSTVGLTFRRDPSDPNFGGVTVWAKGYQGNQSPTQVASGQDSPISFILTNTGEALSLIVQANGNGGSAPIGTAPTTGLTLPKSSGGGVGTTTTTSNPPVSIALSVPGELSVSGSPISTATGGTFAVSKSTQASQTAWRGPISGSATPTFRREDPLDMAIHYDLGYFMQSVGSGTYAIVSKGCPTANTATTGATGSAVTTVSMTTTEYGMQSLLAGSTASTLITYFSSINLSSNALSTPNGFPFVKIKRFCTRGALTSTTQIRVWTGLGSSSVLNTSQTWAGDTPTANFAAFRYSRTTTGGNWFACTGTSAANITATDTGIAGDTNVHDFRIEYDGSKVYFFIDNALVVTNTTNIPSSSNVGMLATVDNQNHAAQAGWNFAYMYETLA